MVKDQEFLKEKALYCIDYAKKKSATDVQIILGNSISETVNFRNRNLDESERSDSLSISLTIYIGKKKSTISSSNLSKENLVTLIERCIDTTKITPEDEFNSLPDNNLLAKDFKELDLYDDTHLSNNKKIDFLKETEEAASNNDKINNTESSFTETKSNFILANSDGFLNGYKSSSFSASCVAVAAMNGAMEKDYEYTRKRHLIDIKKPEEIGSVAAKKASEKLNPRKIGSEKISLIFDKRISKGILGTLASSIVASSIARGTSFLKNKLDQEIFSKEINVIDKPDILKGLGSMPFDSEGVQSKELKIIENGILKNYLIDTYNGKKLNLSSNGRSGGTTNIYFEKGKISYEELLKIHPKALYVTETIGHGSNLVTGDYSVGASGFLIENGVFTYPVSEITIAGNFKDIFKNITLSDDLEFDYVANSPTMLIEGMIVAGK